MMPSSTSCSGARPARDFPSNSIVPADGLTSPEIAFSVVDLPAPFAPISATISPRLISTSTPCKAGMFAYSTCRPSMRSMASLICAALRGSPICLFRPEIGFDHPRMITNVGGASVCKLLAVIENGDAVASAHHNLHMVLHKHHRHAGSLNAADKADELTCFGSVQTGSGLVRQNQFWSANECARDFEEALMPVGQASGNDVRQVR